MRFESVFKLLPFWVGYLFQMQGWKTFQKLFFSWFLLNMHEVISKNILSFFIIFLKFFFKVPIHFSLNLNAFHYNPLIQLNYPQSSDCYFHNLPIKVIQPLNSHYFAPFKFMFYVISSQLSTDSPHYTNFSRTREHNHHIAV